MWEKSVIISSSFFCYTVTGSHIEQGCISFQATFDLSIFPSQLIILDCRRTWSNFESIPLSLFSRGVSAVRRDIMIQLMGTWLGNLGVLGVSGVYYCLSAFFVLFW